MRTRILISKHTLTALLAGGVMAACLVSTSGQDARFFRIAGPVATRIMGMTADGTITWTNTPTNATFTVQTATTLHGPSNWVDYVRAPASNAVTVQRIFDRNPPSGMVLIPAGSFTMGDNQDGDTSALPLHTVYVSAFYMDANLVSYSQWLTVYNWAIAHGYTFDSAGSGKASTHPVQAIDWWDCAKWCNARSEKEGRVPAYYTDAGLSVRYRTGDVAPYVNWGTGYRLPTEAEWEKAARGGASGQRFPWGSTISWSQANYYADPLSGGGYAYDVNPTSGYDPAWTSGGYPYTTPVGTFAANGYGLYDMAGNVWQWCWDWYGSYSSGSQTDPRGPTSGSVGRVDRGGSWLFYAFNCRTADRGSINPTYGYNNLGFRSVLPAGQ
jgi:formylglycine-generating enzyme required for sulfatase activity